jgi:hypothetical protein
LANVIAAAEDGSSDLKPGVRKNLLAGRDYIEVAGPVVNVARDIALPQVESKLPAEPASPDELRALSGEWGLASALDRLATALEWKNWS